MGIVVLILIVLVIELSQRQLKSAARQQSNVRRDVAKVLADMEREIASLRAFLQQESLGESTGYSSDELELALAEVQRDLESLEKLNQTAKKRVAAKKKALQKEQSEFSEQSKNRRLEEIETQIIEITRKQAEWQDKQRVVFHPAHDEFRTPWIIELRREDYLVAQYGVRAKPSQFVEADDQARIRSLLAWLEQRNASRDYFHILVKPGGLAAFEEIYTELRDSGFTVGFDLIGEDDSALDLELGTESPISNQGS
jgi:hypothetical protein